MTINQSLEKIGVKTIRTNGTRLGKKIVHLEYNKKRVVRPCIYDLDEALEELGVPAQKRSNIFN